MAIIVLESETTCTKRGFKPFPHHIRQQVDILNFGICLKTLMDVVIVNLIRLNMVQHASSITTMHALTMVD